MRALIEESLHGVQKWVEDRHYKGYDPGDGLTSYLRPLTCGNIFAERVLQQLIWKAPVNVRPLVGVVPMESTKGRGFMAWGYLYLHKAFGDKGSLKKATACLRLAGSNERSRARGSLLGKSLRFHYANRAHVGAHPNNRLVWADWTSLP